jgi:hypothetical protein
MTAREVELFRTYLAERPDVRSYHQEAYGEQYFRIDTLAGILSNQVAWHTDPAHGTPAKRLAAIKAAQEEFVQGREQIYNMFGAWLNKRTALRDLPTEEER